MAESIYHGWDCHAYTEDCKALWLAWQTSQVELSEILKLPLSQAELNVLFSALDQLISDPVAKQALEKIKGRYQLEKGGYEDGQLLGCNVIRLLEEVYKRVIASKEPSMMILLTETLSEIGQTCLEGDSHRLLMFLAALI